MLYLPTCVGLGYGLNVGAISWTTSLHTQSVKHVQLTSSVTTNRFRNINLIPIDYGFALVLGADSPCAD